MRIGYVSPDFRNHAVGRNICPVLRHHDHQQFDISLYAQLAKADSMTEKLGTYADHWCPIADMTDEQVADKIRQDGIDILVDLTLHMAGNRLLVFARKPAPVQVTFIGYPGTTGLETIDYRLTDPYFDPPGLDDAWYSEATYRLPHTAGCYDSPDRRTPCSSAACFGERLHHFWLTEQFLQNQRWGSGTLGVRAAGRAGITVAPFRPRRRPSPAHAGFLARHGIATGRVEFCSFRPFAAYLALYNQIDIGLDTLPYNGHTTSMDSYWMGVPVITLAGQTVVGRGGMSQAKNLGLEELTATMPAEFVERAVTLAADLPKLQALRAGLRERMKQSPLMDARGFAQGIEQAYRAMWRKWCARVIG